MDSLAYAREVYPALHASAVEKISASGAFDRIKTAQAAAARGAEALLQPRKGIIGWLQKLLGAPEHYAKQLPGIHGAGFESGVGAARGKYNELLSAAEGEVQRLRPFEGQVAGLKKQLERAGKPPSRWPLPLGIGAGVIGLPTAYYMGKGSEADEARKQKLLAFGGGAAAGLFLPKVIRGLTSGASSLGMLPSQGY